LASKATKLNKITKNKGHYAPTEGDRLDAALGLTSSEDAADPVFRVQGKGEY